MTMRKTLLMLSALWATTPLFAQTSSADKTTPPYGENPNIFAVLGHKTAKKVQDTAQKVDAATQKGIAKIKPKVDHAWENSKTYSAEQAAIAKENSQKAAQAVNQKWQETKHTIIGQPNEAPAPIEQHPLSQSSSNTEPAALTEPSLPHSHNTEETPTIRL